MTKEELQKQITALQEETIKGSITASRLGTILTNLLSLADDTAAIEAEATRAKTVEATKANKTDLEDFEDSINSVDATFQTTEDEVTITMFGHRSSGVDEEVGAEVVMPMALSTRAGMMSAAQVNKIDAAATSVDLMNYMSSGKYLPTKKAVFLYNEKLTHHRTIWDEQPEIGEETGYYHVFCCVHDAEQQPDNRGSLYIVYDANRTFYKTYDATTDDVPDIILRSFGEAEATTSKAGLMSSADKRKLANMEAFLKTIGYDPNKTY